MLKIPKNSYFEPFLARKFLEQDGEEASGQGAPSSGFSKSRGRGERAERKGKIPRWGIFPVFRKKISEQKQIVVK